MPLSIRDSIGISLFFTILATFMLSACTNSANPSADNALAVFKDSRQWQSRVKNNSAKLVSFEETKTQNRNIDGRDIFRLYFNASVKQLTPGQSEECSKSITDECVKNISANSETLKGFVLFEKSDVGWEPAGMIFE